MPDDEIIHMLKVTTSEEFEYDRETVRRAMMGWLPTYADPHDFEACVAEFFEYHTGSQYGDNLFGATGNFDSGIELFTRTPEKDVYHDNEIKPGHRGDILS